MLVYPATVVGKSKAGERTVLVLDLPSMSRPWRFSAWADDPMVTLFENVEIGQVLRLEGVPAAHFNSIDGRYETRLTAYAGMVTDGD